MSTSSPIVHSESAEPSDHVHDIDCAFTTYHPSFPAFVKGRSAHSTAFIDCVVYMFGGLVDDGVRENGVPVNELFAYRPTEYLWEAVEQCGDVPAPVYGHTAVAAGSKMIVFGGMGERSFTERNTLHVFNTLNMSWERIPEQFNEDRPQNRWGHSMTPWSDTSYLLFGGSQSSQYYNDVWVLDASSMRFRSIGTTAHREHRPKGRRRHSAVVYDDSMIIYGGRSDLYDFLADMWKLDLRTSTWRELVVADAIPTQVIPVKTGNPFCLPHLYDTPFIAPVSYTTESIVAARNEKREIKRRHSERTGHSTIMFENRLIVYGGFSMIQDTKNDKWSITFDDCFELDLSKPELQWKKLHVKLERMQAKGVPEYCMERQMLTQYVLVDVECVPRYLQEILKQNPGKRPVRTAPPGRTMHTALVHNNSMLVIGGRDRYSQLDDVFEVKFQSYDVGLRDIVARYIASSRMYWKCCQQNMMRGIPKEIQRLMSADAAAVFRRHGIPAFVQEIQNCSADEVMECTDIGDTDVDMVWPRRYFSTECPT